MAHLDLQTGTYAAADTLLGTRDSRNIGHNTRLHRVGWRTSEDRVPLAVQYHSTDIVTLTADGWLEMSTGGWHTVTTWARINALLPGSWRVGSDRGTSWLYNRGRKVTPYVDGLAINADAGAVGMGSDILLTAEDVAAILTAADAADAARAEKRAARLLREHPTVGGPRTHTASLYERRARDCDRCTAEMAAEREARRAALAADHRASDNAAGGGPDTWAAYSGAHKNYRDKRECPYDCPERSRSW